jgi:iron(III) transport system substrate-binding protein
MDTTIDRSFAQTPERPSEVRKRAGRARVGWRWAGAAAVLAMLGAAGCREASSPEAREVVVYCSVDQEVAEPVLAAFEAQTGIRVLPHFDTEAAKVVRLVQRIRGEADRPEADVYWSGEVFHTIRLAQEGLLEPYALPAGETWPQDMTDAQGRWHGFALRARAVVWHTGRVKGEEAPRRIEDLLDPKWRGRIVMASPEFGTTCGHVASWFAWYGPERAEEILRGLKANQVQLVDGNSTAVRMVATGQADVCLTDTDDFYAGLRNGWPVGMHVVRHGDGGALTFPNTAALIRGGPHPASARALMAFLLSESVERMIARSDSHNTPVHATLAAEFPDYALPSRLAVSYPKVADQVPVAVTTALKILK